MSSLTLIICGTSISSANAIAGARQTGMTISSQIPIDAKGTYALGIALDQFGHFYIVGAENGDGIGKVLKYDSGGTFEREIGSSGIGEDQFSIGGNGHAGPGAVALDLSGNVYVTDLGHDYLLKFASDGTFLSSFANSDNPNENFDDIGYVSISPDGFVFINGTEDGVSVIKKYDRLGNYITQFSDFSGEGGFGGGMGFDYEGNIYVANTMDNAVTKISSTGEKLLQFGNTGGNALELPTDVSVDISGNIYVANFFGVGLSKFDASGNFIETIGSEWYDGGNGPIIYDLDIDNEGSIYVPSIVDGEITKFNDTDFSIPLDADRDNDGITDVIEDGAPNGGDANEDGIKDKRQTTVTSSLEDGSETYTTLVNAGCSENGSVSNLTPDDVDGNDGEYNYPYGLTSFILKCQVADSAVIEKYTFTDEAATDFVVRKYIPLTDTFSTIDDADIESVAIGGENAIKVTYLIDDGGVLDDDGAVNGEISDPVGLAKVLTSSQDEENDNPNANGGNVPGVTDNSSPSNNSRSAHGQLASTGLNVQDSVWISIRLLLVGIFCARGMKMDRKSEPVKRTI